MNRRPHPPLAAVAVLLPVALAVVLMPSAPPVTPPTLTPADADAGLEAELHAAESAYHVAVCRLWERHRPATEVELMLLEDRDPDCWAAAGRHAELLARQEAAGR